jgi:hypothetical protein
MQNLCNVNCSGESLRLDEVHCLIKSELTRVVLSQNTLKMAIGVIPYPFSRLYNGWRKPDA